MSNSYHDPSVGFGNVVRLRLNELHLEGTPIRQFEANGRWFFAVEDVVQALRDETNVAQRLWRTFVQRRDQRAFQDLMIEVTIDGEKVAFTDAVGLIRLIEGIRGRKVEPLKRWIARVVYERATEEANPELAVTRSIENWYRRGRDDAWVMHRLRTIHTRKCFTDEMQTHGVAGEQYAVLTNIVHRGTFEISVREHESLKGLTPGKNKLRDNMTHLELIFTALGEASSTAISQQEPDRSYAAAEKSCRVGGQVAGRARKDLERQLGRRVVTSESPEMQGHLGLECEADGEGAS